jgi:hypothetical protein
MLRRCLFGSVLALSLVACGGGGGSADLSMDEEGVTSPDTTNPLPDEGGGGNDAGGGTSGGNSNDGGDGTITPPPDEPAPDTSLMQPVTGALTFERPGSIAADSNGNLYVADHLRVTLTRIAPDGTMHIVAGSTGVRETVDGQGSDARFSLIGDMTVDSAGNVYLVDGKVLRRITPDGVVVTLPVTFFDPENRHDYEIISGVATHPSGDVMVSFYSFYPTSSHSGIYRIAPDGHVTKIKEALPSDPVPREFGLPKDVTVAGDGTIFFAQSDEVFRLENNEQILFPAWDGDPRGDRRFLGAHDLVFDDQNNLYVMERDGGGKTTPASGRVKKITSDGNVTLLYYDYYGGSGITSHPDGHIYFTFNQAIMRIAPDGAVSTYVDAATYAGAQ